MRRRASRSSLLREALDDRVDDERHVGVGSDALLLELGDDRLGQVAHAFAAEYQSDGGDVDFSEQRLEIGGREASLAISKPSESTPALRSFSASALAVLRAIDVMV